MLALELGMMTSDFSIEIQLRCFQALTFKGINQTSKDLVSIEF